MMVRKQLQYLLDYFLSDYILTNFEEYKEFIYLYLEYLSYENEGTFWKIVEFINKNISAKTIYSELLSQLYEERFPFYDETKIDLTDDEKRSLVDNEAIVNSYKGKLQGFYFLPELFSDIQALEIEEGDPFNYSVTISSAKSINVLNEYIDNVHPIGWLKTAVFDSEGTAITDTMSELSDSVIAFEIEVLEFSGKYFFDATIQHNHASISEITFS